MKFETVTNHAVTFLMNTTNYKLWGFTGEITSFYYPDDKMLRIIDGETGEIFLNDMYCESEELASKICDCYLKKVHVINEYAAAEAVKAEFDLDSVK